MTGNSKVIDISKLNQELIPTRDSMLKMLPAPILVASLPDADVGQCIYIFSLVMVTRQQTIGSKQVTILKHA